MVGIFYFIRVPYTKFAGLDVAMSEDGPVIVEVNVAPDKDGAAYGLIQSNKLLQAAHLARGLSNDK